MKTRSKTTCALFVAVLMAGFVGLAVGPMTFEAKASTADVTVTWVIPSDKTISVSYPTSLTAVTFTPGVATFARQKADSQTDAVAAYRVTNDGNVAVKVTGQFSGTPPSGVSEFLEANSSSSNVPPTTLIQWVCTAVVDTSQSPAGHCNTASNWTTATMGVVTSLAAAGTFDKWCWSWGTTVAAGTNSATLVLTSS